MEALFFEPMIEVSDWPKVIKALKVLYPNIRWGSGVELSADGVWFVSNGLIIHGGIPYLEHNLWDSKEDFINRVKYIDQDIDIKDGWEYLGFKQDIDFDSLYESKLIRKAIKESIDEFDWVDTNPSLYDLISNFFKHEHPEYWLEKDFGHVLISDKTGNYIQLEESEFTIENIRETLYKDIINLEKDGSYKIKDEYIQLAKVLEPIIGPINID